MNSILVSVIVPVYNVANYLDICLCSLLNQSYKNIELILVDDGSTDGSQSMCDDYFSKYPEIIKVIHKNNEGLGFARNSGLQIASGQYVMFVDSDDYVDKTAIEKLVSCLVAHSSDTAICGYCKVFEDGTNECHEVCFNNICLNTRNEIENLLLNMIGTGPEMKAESIVPVSVWHALYSLDIIRDNGILFPSEREYISEDIVFDLSYFSSCNSVSFVSAPLYFYRQNNVTSLTHRFRFDEFEKHKKMYFFIRESLGKRLGYKTVDEHTSRFLLGRARTCIEKSITHKRYEKNFDLFGFVSDIVNDGTIQSILSVYPYRKNPLKLRIYNICMRTKAVGLVILLSKLNKRTKKHSRF